MLAQQVARIRVTILTRDLTDQLMTTKIQSLHGKIWDVSTRKRVGCRPESFPRVRPRVNLLINDNYCVTFLFPSRLTGSREGLKRRTLTPYTDNRLSFKCKASCCKTCSFCTRTAAKERHKSWVSRVLPSNRLQIKICAKCFMCHSIVLCENCSKCHECCFKSTCRGKASKLLAGLAKSGCQSDSGSNHKRGIHPPFPDPLQTSKISHCRELLCKSPQEQLPAGGIASAYRQKRSRAGTKSKIPGFLQPAIFSPKTKQQMETYTGSEQTQSFLQGGKIQDGDTGNHQNLPSDRGMGNLDRLQGCLLPYSHTGTIQEISEISCPGTDIPIQSTAIRSVHSTLGVHCDSKGGETDGHPKGYKNPPVPRRLVGESHIPPGLSSAYSRSSENVQRTRLAGELGEIRAGTQANFRFCRLPVRSQIWSGPAHTGPVAKSTGQNTENIVPTGLSGPAVHVLDRSTNSHRKTSSPRSFTHEAHTMASQKQLENTGITGKSDSYPQLPAPSFAMVAERT